MDSGEREEPEAQRAVWSEDGWARGGELGEGADDEVEDGGMEEEREDEQLVADDGQLLESRLGHRGRRRARGWAYL